MKATQTEPLLDAGQLPRFNSIRGEEIEPSLRALLSRISDQFDELERTVEPSWEGTVGRLYEIQEPLDYAWRIVDLLRGAKNTPELRAAHEALQPEVVAIQLRISQSKPFYDALQKLKASSWETLDDARRRVVEWISREAELSGVALEGSKLERFKQIETELASLGTKFSNNVLDSTKQFGLTLTTKEEVDGIPETILGVMAKNAADDEGLTESDPIRGPWKATLDGPVAAGILRHATDRSLREQIYRAYFTVAASGELDNHPLIGQILELRKEQAGLLGFSTYAEMNFHRKMVDSADTVASFLSELRDPALPRAKQHVAELTQFARDRTGDERFEIQAWDKLFWNEKLREDQYGFNSEELRKYFPFEQVLQGLFDFCTRMFEITFEPAPGEADVWDPDVRLFRVLDASGAHIAYLYIDPFTRPGEKEPGAWAHHLLSRHRHEDGTLQLPAAWIVCNQTPPVGDTPSMMTFNEVITLFHEAGHALHNLLTRVDFAWCSGNNNIEWDAIEIPSTFMENWCYDRNSLLQFARDHETGAPMPDDLFERMVKARNFDAAGRISSQLWYTDIDLELHHFFDPQSDESIDDVQRRINERDLVLPEPEGTEPLCSFGHIFDGGYAAGYYTYLWSEMLSTDAFYAFKEQGEDQVVEVGRKFRDTILAKGGSLHPSEIFREFRGREPSTKPLIEHLGLAGAGDQPALDNRAGL